ncbi:hypothetical protein BDK51DRAFT_33025 [Blyttiomyces helicus]|uniref:Uncharacterized protein n=1 Tax=Blyttiomyces helicus TaxID=388810 RepID=A0A4P9W2S5_9FUNG|nr:hypothetical protein BDK51DRAFT_33025 [Blyttiomyces helicus]|eukprot:RKO84366.1 hypothetical protein BDK51DRAFT_33025 [Blyttiomyces helicus]
MVGPLLPVGPLLLSLRRLPLLPVLVPASHVSVPFKFPSSPPIDSLVVFASVLQYIQPVPMTKHEEVTKSYPQSKKEGTQTLSRWNHKSFLSSTGFERESKIAAGPQRLITIARLKKNTFETIPGFQTWTMRSPGQKSFACCEREKDAGFRHRTETPKRDFGGLDAGRSGLGSHTFNSIVNDGRSSRRRMSGLLVVKAVWIRETRIPGAQLGAPFPSSPGAIRSEGNQKSKESGTKQY